MDKGKWPGDLLHDIFTEDDGFKRMKRYAAELDRLGLSEQAADVRHHNSMSNSFMLLMQTLQEQERDEQTGC